MLETLLVTAAVCSWNNPGVNRYQHEPVKALVNYAFNPIQKQELAVKMERRQYDEFVEIKRNSISGENIYVNLRGMHFGDNKVCARVDTSKWPEEYTERGLVYCPSLGDTCVLVPTVCNNVSLVTRVKIKSFPTSNKTESTESISVPDISMSSIPSLDPIPSAFTLSNASALNSPLLHPVGQITNTRAFSPVGYFPVGATFPSFIQPYSPPVTPFLPPVIPGIPEPSTFLLVGLGIITIARFSTRK